MMDKDNVDGSIMRIDHDIGLVLCELYTEPKHRSVNVPLKHFHHSIQRVGLPINFKVDSDKRLIITYREIERDPADDEFWDSFNF